MDDPGGWCKGRDIGSSGESRQLCSPLLSGSARPTNTSCATTAAARISSVLATQPVDLRPAIREADLLEHVAVDERGEDERT